MKSSTSSMISKVPSLIQRINECQYCYQAAECLTYHAAIEGGNDVSSGVGNLFKHITKGE